MPAKQKYLSPPEQLVELAKEARVAGKTFDEFWEAAMPPLVPVPRKVGGEVVGWKTEDDGSVMERPSRRLPRVDDVDPPDGAILWPSDTFDRNNWYRAIIWGKENWRLKYEGMESPLDQAIAILARP